MAGNISDFLENKLIDHSLGTASYTAPTSVTVALFTSNPTDAGTGAEVTTTQFPSYARQACTFNPATNGATTNKDTLTWTFDGGSALTISHIGLYSNTGDLLWHGALSTAKTLNNTDKFELPSGNLNVSLD